MSGLSAVTIRLNNPIDPAVNLYIVTVTI